MPKICYKPHRFSQSQRNTITMINQILDSYRARGFVLSVRQAYYALVSKGVIENTQQSYKSIINTIDNGRLAGLIDWNMIEDRTRNLQQRSHFDSPTELLEAACNSYRLDRWEGQKYRVTCFIEKDALSGVFSPVCRKWDVPLFPCRGYVSQSEMWRAAMRMGEYADAGQHPVIIHFGDHDPSGTDMTRDISDRLAMFGCDVVVNRLALNMDQVKQYDPPPNPAKASDSRFQAYLTRYGNESWELDALDPAVLAGLVEDAISEFRDPGPWNKIVEREIEQRALLKTCAAKWNEIQEHVELEFPTTTVKIEDELEASEQYKHELTGE